MKISRFIQLLFLIVVQHTITVKALTAIDITNTIGTPFIFIENNTDNNFFVTPSGVIDPRMTGSNRWTGLKGIGRQVSLGYIDNGHNTPLIGNYMFDAWVDNLPISTPFIGLRCIFHFPGCNQTSLIEPQLIDDKGFYGLKVPVLSTGYAWMHSMMSDNFYLYLQRMAVGNSFTMTINNCTTPTPYDVNSGERCKDQASGVWYRNNVTHSKGAHIKFINTDALTEVFINSDGVPTLGEGNTNCKMQTVGVLSGVSCKMVSYSIQSTGLSNATVLIFPSINNPLLEPTEINKLQLQFSLNGNTWKPVLADTQFYNFNELRGSDSVFIFFSSDFFKRMIDLGLTNANSKDLFNFNLKNTLTPESGWYEFSASNGIIIKPRNFSISIISDEHIASPSREGFVGSGKPSLDFGYIVTTNGKTSADEVLIKVNGPEEKITGRSYCIFSSLDNSVKVPFPGVLSFTTQSGGTKTYDVGCDDNWRDMTDALWITTPWVGSEGEAGVMDKTTVKFSIPMDDVISQKTVDHTDWFGEVSASGEIHVQATWRNIN